MNGLDLWYLQIFKYSFNNYLYQVQKACGSKFDLAVHL